MLDRQIFFGLQQPLRGFLDRWFNRGRALGPAQDSLKQLLYPKVK